jgi:LDH2 family malate/lactate/ureidoglycolate dehydrogenase
MEKGSVGVVDGGLAPGQHSCMVAAKLAAKLAKQHCIGYVTVKDSTHFGAATPYLQALLDQGMVGMVGSNSSQSMGTVLIPL